MWVPLKTPFNCQPLIYDMLFKNNLRDTSLSLSHLAPARLPRDASSRLVLFEFAKFQRFSEAPFGFANRSTSEMIVKVHNLAAGK
jgi:hypothetical protein